MPHPPLYSLDDAIRLVVEKMYATNRLVTSADHDNIVGVVIYRHFTEHFYNFLELCFESMEADPRGVPQTLQEQFEAYKLALPFGLAYSKPEIFVRIIDKLVEFIRENHRYPRNRDIEVNNHLQRLSKTFQFDYATIIMACRNRLDQKGWLTKELEYSYKVLNARYSLVLQSSKYKGQEGLLRALDIAVDHMFQTDRLLRTTVDHWKDKAGEEVFDSTGSSFYALVKKNKKNWGISGWAAFLDLCLRKMDEDERETTSDLWGEFMLRGNRDWKKYSFEFWCSEEGKIKAFDIVKSHLVTHKRIPSKEKYRQIRIVRYQLEKQEIQEQWGCSNWIDMLRQTIKTLDDPDKGILEVELEKYLKQYGYLFL